MGFLLLLLYFATPIVVVLFNGTTYTFGFSLSGVGLILHILSTVPIRRYITKRAPQMANDSMWELTAGMGIVPRWVSEMGLACCGPVHRTCSPVRPCRGALM